MNEKPKRGCFLTGWLVLGLIGSFFGMFIILSNQQMVKMLPDYPQLPKSILIISTIISAIQFISIIGVFIWKKVAVYAYGTLALVSFAFSMFSNEMTTAMIVGGIIGLLLNLWATYALMKLFKQMENNEEEVM